MKIIAYEGSVFNENAVMYSNKIFNPPDFFPSSEDGSQS